MAGPTLRASSIVKHLSSWCNLGMYPPTELNVSSIKSKRVIENGASTVCKSSLIVQQ